VCANYQSYSVSAVSDQAEIPFTFGALDFIAQEITSNEFTLSCTAGCVWAFCSTGQKIMSSSEGYL